MQASQGGVGATKRALVEGVGLQERFALFVGDGRRLGSGKSGERGLRKEPETLRNGLDRQRNVPETMRNRGKASDFGSEACVQSSWKP